MAIVLDVCIPSVQLGDNIVQFWSCVSKDEGMKIPGDSPPSEAHSEVTGMLWYSARFK